MQRHGGNPRRWGSIGGRPHVPSMSEISPEQRAGYFARRNLFAGTNRRPPSEHVEADDHADRRPRARRGRAPRNCADGRGPAASPRRAEAASPPRTATRNGRSGRARRSMTIIATVSGSEIAKISAEADHELERRRLAPGIARVARQPSPLRATQTTNAGTGSNAQASLRSGRLSSKAAIAARTAVASDGVGARQHEGVVADDPERRQQRAGRDQHERDDQHDAEPDSARSHGGGSRRTGFRSALEVADQSRMSSPSVIVRPCHARRPRPCAPQGSDRAVKIDLQCCFRSAGRFGCILERIFFERQRLDCLALALGQGRDRSAKPAASLLRTVSRSGSSAAGCSRTRSASRFPARPAGPACAGYRSCGAA